MVVQDLRLYRYLDIDSNNFHGRLYVNSDVEWTIDDPVARSSAVKRTRK